MAGADRSQTRVGRSESNELVKRESRAGPLKDCAQVDLIGRWRLTLNHASQARHAHKSLRERRWRRLARRFVNRLPWSMEPTIRVIWRPNAGSERVEKCSPAVVLCAEITREPTPARAVDMVAPDRAAQTPARSRPRRRRGPTDQCRGVRVGQGMPGQRRAAANW